MPIEEPAVQFKPIADCERGICNHPHHRSHVDRDPGGHLACAEHNSQFNMYLDDLFTDEGTATYRKSSAELEKLQSAIHIREIILEQRTD